jgi:hypothetical protein
MENPISNTGAGRNAGRMNVMLLIEEGCERTVENEEVETEGRKRSEESAASDTGKSISNARLVGIPDE